MNKFLRYSLSLVLAFVANVALMAAEPYKVLTFPDDNKANNGVSSYVSKWEAKMGDDVWTIENFNNNKWNNNWTYIKCGSKNADSEATIQSPVFTEAIDYVVLTLEDIDATNVTSIRVGFYNNKGSQSTDIFPGKDIVNPGKFIVKLNKFSASEPNSYIKIAVKCKKSKNGIFSISKIECYKAGDVPESATTNTAETAFTVAQAKKYIDDVMYSDGARVYVKGIISSISKVDTSYGNATFNISDDGKDENTLTIFRARNIGGASFKAEDEIKVGDEVVLYGSLINYNGTHELASSPRIISINSNPTSISTITTDAAAENAPAFNLAGQKVGKAYKGVVIKGGKKFIQK